MSPQGFHWPKTLESLLGLEANFIMITSEHFGSFTNHQLYQLVLTLKRGLEQSGLSAGHYVFDSGEDALMSWLGLLACATLDLVFVPLNPKLDRQARQSIERRYAKAADLSDFEAILRMHVTTSAQELDDQGQHPIHLQRPQLAILSSGSTAMPKVVFHSLESLFESAYSSNHFYHIDSRDRLLLSLGLFHIGGLQIAIRAALARAVLLIGRGPRYCFEDLQALRPTIVSLVPTQLYDLLETKGGLDVLRRHLRLILLGGAACPQSLLERVRQYCLPVSICYGATESGAQVLATNPGELPLDSDCAGQVLPLREVRVHQGLLQFRAWGCARAIDAGDGTGPRTISAGTWIETKDRAEQNGESIRILGRLDDVIMTGGESIDLARIRRIFEAGFPQLRVSYLATNDQRLGQRYELLLESQTMPERSLLNDFLQQELSSIQRPLRIFWHPLQALVTKRSRSDLLALMTAKANEVKLVWSQT